MRAAGTAAHRVLERFPLQRWGEQVDGAKSKDCSPATVPNGDPVDSARRSARTSRDFSASRVRRCMSAKAGRSTYREEPFVLELGSGREKLRLRGTIDLLAAFPDGSADIIDYKSSGRADDSGNTGDDARDFQLLAYGLAARRRYRLTPVRAGIVDPRHLRSHPTRGPSTTPSWRASRGACSSCAARSWRPGLKPISRVAHENGAAPSSADSSAPVTSAIYAPSPSASASAAPSSPASAVATASLLESLAVASSRRFVEHRLHRQRHPERRPRCRWRRRVAHPARRPWRRRRLVRWFRRPDQARPSRRPGLFRRGAVGGTIRRCSVIQGGVGSRGRGVACVGRCSTSATSAAVLGVSGRAAAARAATSATGSRSSGSCAASCADRRVRSWDLIAIDAGNELAPGGVSQNPSTVSAAQIARLCLIIV